MGEDDPEGHDQVAARHDGDYDVEALDGGLLPQDDDRRKRRQHQRRDQRRDGERILERLAHRVADHLTDAAPADEARHGEQAGRYRAAELPAPFALREGVEIVGRELVNARFRYTGQQIVEHKEAKFRTRHFYIDIYDEAFSQAKEAAEVWIGDDENHIPVKIRAKLKIGAAEVYYKDSYNLRAPLTCRIVVQKK